MKGFSWLSFVAWLLFVFLTLCIFAVGTIHPYFLHPFVPYVMGLLVGGFCGMATMIYINSYIHQSTGGMWFATIFFILGALWLVWKNYNAEKTTETKAE
jgi:hypothetical protein